MTEVISPEDIKKTQNSLSQYIKEPPLTDKLLRKPPFRFLHDIIKSVIKETGFLSDVFTVDDLNLENIKDKEGKIAFLKKLIAAIKDATGISISAKPNKIVAGLEVTKTLELLQAVGKGISLKKSGKLNDSKERNVNKKNLKEKNGNNPGKSNKDALQEGVDNNKKKEKSDWKGTTEKKKKENPKKKDEPLKKKIDPKKDRTEAKGDLKNNEKNEGLENANKVQAIVVNGVKEAEDVGSKSGNENHADRNSSEQIEATIVENGTDHGNADADPTIHNGEPKKKEDSLLKVEKKPSARRQTSRTRPASKSSNENIRGEADKEKGDNSSTRKAPKEAKSVTLPLLGAVDAPPISVPKIERPTTARKAPPSARPPGAPKAKDRGEVKLPETVDKEADVKPVEVITEDLVLEDDKENMVVVEAQPLTLENDLKDAKLIKELENEEIGENEGALVAQILETKKELEESKQLWANTNQKSVEIEWEGGRKQKRDSWEKEVVKLREWIQELTRTTNPLGKLFDFIQEDVDSMQRELKSWTAVTHKYKEQLTKEQKLTENTLEKYKKQLAEVDSLIEQEQEAVRNIKANIYANDKKIFNLVTRSRAP